MTTNWAPFLAFEGIAGSRDKNGIELVTVSYYVPTLLQARTYVPSGLEAEIGLPLRPVRTFQQEWGNAKLISQGKDGAYKVTFHFEGIQNPLAGEQGVQFEADGTVSDEPAESHPDIKFLLDKYDGRVEDGKLVFSEDLPVGGNAINTGITVGNVSGDFGPTLSSTRGTMANPLFGFKKWKVPGLSWTKTYAILSVPAEITRRLGKIETPPVAPDGYLPTIPDHRRWLKVVAKPVWRGNVWRVTETWLAGSWNRDIYR